MFFDRFSQAWLFRGQCRGDRAVVLLVIMLFSACVKDGIQAPKDEPLVPVRLSLELMAGTSAYGLGRPMFDGAGHVVRFTAVKGYLSGIHLHDDDDAVVADLSGYVALFDGASPYFEVTMGNIPEKHIHDLHFVAGLDREHAPASSFPQGHPLHDPSMITEGGFGRSHLLLEGYADLDGDGAYGAGDAQFRYRINAPELIAERHVHLHADPVAGREMLLRLVLDVHMLLFGVDVLECPEIDDAHPQAQILMANLATAVQVKP